MGTTTKIQWCDSTASPWTGCTPVSSGCDGCYARTLAKRHGWSKEWGAGVPRHRFVGFERSVLAMERKAAAAGGVCVDCGGYVSGGDCPCGQVGACGQLRRPRIFPSLCDWLDPEVPVAWLADLLDVIRRTPHLDWMLLTKRPGLWQVGLIVAMRHNENNRGTAEAHAWMLDWADGTKPPANVWIGATCENQAAADERIPELLRIPAARRFVSVEPMLGPVDVLNLRGSGTGPVHVAKNVHAVFCGGESGPNARPMHPDWARSLRDQCADAGVAFTFKQWGDNPHPSAFESVPMVNAQMGAKAGGRLLDGREWNGESGPVWTCRGLSVGGKDGAR